MYARKQQKLSSKNYHPQQQNTTKIINETETFIIFFIITPKTVSMALSHDMQSTTPLFPFFLGGRFQKFSPRGNRNEAFSLVKSFWNCCSDRFWAVLNIDFDWLADMSTPCHMYTFMYRVVKNGVQGFYFWCLGIFEEKWGWHWGGSRWVLRVIMNGLKIDKYWILGFWSKAHAVRSESLSW